MYCCTYILYITPHRANDDRRLANKIIMIQQQYGTGGSLSNKTMVVVYVRVYSGRHIRTIYVYRISAIYFVYIYMSFCVCPKAYRIQSVANEMKSGSMRPGRPV